MIRRMSRRRRWGPLGAWGACAGDGMSSASGGAEQVAREVDRVPGGSGNDDGAWSARDDRLNGDRARPANAQHPATGKPRVRRSAYAEPYQRVRDGRTSSEC